jgi:nicotinamide-nucleotide amidase
VSASEIRSLARALLDLCKMRKLTIATAESCTGGLVCASLVDIPGSSAVVTTGFITYSNDAKHEFLGVSSETLETFGAVSKETAVSMATGALAKAKSDLTVSVTGIAGPGGATPGKPVGLVHIAVAARDGRVISREKRFGAIGRTAVRMRSVVEALKMLTELARGPAKVVKLKRQAAGADRLRPRASRTLRQSAGTRRRTSRP